MRRGQSKELPIPPAAARDPGAVEVLRVWAASDGQQFVLAPGVWDDPAVWGILLVDLARHAARMHSERGRCGFDEALSRIREGFDAEWSVSTNGGCKPG